MDMLISIVVNAIIFGEMAVLVGVISKKSTAFQERIDTSNTAMKNLKIPDEIQNEVREYLIATHEKLEQQEEIARFSQMISASLKVEVSQQIFYSITKKNKVIHNIVKMQIKDFSEKVAKHPSNLLSTVSSPDTLEHEIISSIVKYLIMELKNPEDIVIMQNTCEQEMYYIANGICTVQILDQTKKLNKCIRNLLPGDHFGEICLIYGSPRTATVISRNYSTLGKMTLEVYHDLTTEYPAIISGLKEYIFQYDDPLTMFCKESLERVPFLQGIGNEAIYDLMFSLRKRF